MTLDPDKNVRALLSAIAWAEGTERKPEPYRVCYAYSHTIASFADHPFDSKEWPGVFLTEQQCRGAGLQPGCRSTAAGRYQIIVGTWRGLKKDLRLPDFSPVSQDRAAVELLRQTGSLVRIQCGDLIGAVAAARRTWAGLPGAGFAGQPEKSDCAFQAAYLGYGGHCLERARVISNPQSIIPDIVK
jgi:lysozyme